MSKGRILFEVSWADTSMQVPVVRTLIDLDKREVVDSEARHQFIFADGLLCSEAPLSLVGLTDCQVDGLLNHEQLANLLRSLSDRYPPERLPELSIDE